MHGHHADGRSPRPQGCHRAQLEARPAAHVQGGQPDESEDQRSQKDVPSSQIPVRRRRGRGQVGRGSGRRGRRYEGVHL